MMINYGAKLESHGKSKGFTIIELLVVVTIIAVLVSIMLPSMARARKQARLVVCSCSLREIGRCLFMYAMDNNDHYPDSETLGGWKFRAAPGYVDPDDPWSKYERFGLAAMLDGRDLDLLTGKFQSNKPKYLDSQSDIWICPDCQQDWMRELGNTYSFYTGSLLKEKTATDLQRASVATGGLMNSKRWFVWDNISQLPYISGVILPEGVSPTGYVFKPENKKYPHLFGGKYRSAANVLYFDLHVEHYLTPE